MTITVKLPNALYDRVENADDGIIEYRIEEALSRALAALDIHDDVQVVIEWT